MNRVVVTGMGALTPLGNDVNTTWQKAVAGTSGAVPITKFDTTNFKTTFACELAPVDLGQHLDRNERKRADLFTQYALYAAAQALANSGLDLSRLDPFEAGVIWGTGQGGMTTIETEVEAYAAGNGVPRFSPFFVPKIISNMAAGMISMKFGLMGINYTAIAACATANSALMDAFNYIRLGKAKVFITGGSESPISAASIGGFNAMKAMSTRNDDPQAASRPFDTQRDGFVMGEGAGALVLEDLDHAKTRGAHIYAEVVGCAMTADAYHLTAGHPEGKGASHAMRSALAEAGLRPEQVQYLNAHATSTPVGDIGEVRAIDNVFGQQPQNLYISSTKSMTGHLLGAAGAIENIFCIKAINHGVVPPTINLHERDPQIPQALQLVGQQALETPVEVAMNNTFGFGGHNSISLFKKFTG